MAPQRLEPIRATLSGPPLPTHSDRHQGASKRSKLRDQAAQELAASKKHKKHHGRKSGKVKALPADETKDGVLLSTEASKVSKKDLDFMAKIRGEATIGHQIKPVTVLRT